MLQRRVAVKILHAGRLATELESERFVHEGRSAAQFRHSGIVPVLDVGRHDGLTYLVTEFVEGVTLADMLTARRLSFREAAELVLHVAEALNYAHKMGIVHRDIKPSNVMLDRSAVSPINAQRAEMKSQQSGSQTGLLATAQRSPAVTSSPGKPSDGFRSRPRDDAESTMTIDGQLLGTRRT